MAPDLETRLATLNSTIARTGGNWDLEGDILKAAMWCEQREAETREDGPCLETLQPEIRSGPDEHGLRMQF